LRCNARKDDREERDPGGKVAGAVQWVDDPDPLARFGDQARLLFRAHLLAQKTVFRPRRAQPALQTLLHAAIGDGDDAAILFVFTLYVGKARQQFLLRGVAHDGTECVQRG